MMKNFAWAAITHFRISGSSQVHFCSFKGCYQHWYYCRERLYSQISRKLWENEEKPAFLLRLPLRHHIAWFGTFSVDPGHVVSFYANAYHPHTTLAILMSEWYFDPGKIVPLKLGRLSVATILFLSHPYMQGCYQQPYNYVSTITIQFLLSICDPILENLTYRAKCCFELFIILGW